MSRYVGYPECLSCKGVGYQKYTEIDDYDREVTSKHQCYPCMLQKRVEQGEAAAICEHVFGPYITETSTLVERLIDLVGDITFRREVAGPHAGYCLAGIRVDQEDEIWGHAEYPTEAIQNLVVMLDMFEPALIGAPLLSPVEKWNSWYQAGGEDA